MSTILGPDLRVLDSGFGALFVGVSPVLLKGSLLEHQDGVGPQLMTFETDDAFRAACTFG